MAVLKDLVVSFQHAKDLRPSDFCTSCFVWEDDGMHPPFVRFRDSHDPMGGHYNNRQHYGSTIYPAPTMREMLSALKLLIGRRNEVRIQYMGAERKDDCYVATTAYYPEFPNACVLADGKPEDQLAILWLEIYAEKKGLNDRKDAVR